MPDRKGTETVGPNVITLDQDEFNRVCKKVHAFLMRRVDRARTRKETKPSEVSSQKYIETAKEVFVFVHLLELVESMTEEISELRSAVEQVSESETQRGPSRPRSPLSAVPEMFSSGKKTFLN